VLCRHAYKLYNHKLGTAINTSNLVVNIDEVGFDYSKYKTTRGVVELYINTRIGVGGQWLQKFKNSRI
jgi:hypothetical protein